MIFDRHFYSCDTCIFMILWILCQASTNILSLRDKREDVLKRLQLRPWLNTKRQTSWKNELRNCFTNSVRPSPFFIRLLSNAFSDFGSVGAVGKRKKEQKLNWKRSLGLGGPVPQHNIRGAWKQHGVVTKSTWRQLGVGEGKIDVVRAKQEQGKN